MPLTTTDDNAPTSFPNPDYLTLENFKRGVITLVNQGRLPKNALAKLQNGWLIEDGQPAIGLGVDWFTTSPDSNHPIDGWDSYEKNGAIHLVAVSNGTVYRSLDDGQTWTACSGATLTAGKEVNTNQYNSYLYLTTGEDNIVLYDGSTTLVSYTTLATPSAPTIVATPVGSGYTYYYKISAVNTLGFTMASTATTVTHATPRSAWDNTTNFVTITLPAYQVTQTRFDIYFSEDNLNFYYLDSVTNPNLTYKDNGTAQIIPSTLAPITNTTSGPKVGELTNVGARMYGVRDKDKRERIWFTSGQTPYGSFSNGYDGGYLDWQPGGKEYPVHVEDYRDGKGNSIATIWCNSADGQGSIVQMSLNTMTIDTISITVPSAYKLPGSRGTPAPKSVVNVLNDYWFYNSQAFYNLGSRPQLLQVLSTDEMSANIRPTVRTITHGKDNNICAIYYYGKIYISLNYNSDVNNYTAIFDTEMKAWIPEAMTIGFIRMRRYTDTNGSQHLLAQGPGDTRISEISDKISGFYGVAFEHELLTGLYPTTKDRYEFQWTEEMEWEMSAAQGPINLELLGIDRVTGYRTIKTKTMENTVTVAGIGWDTFAWDTTNWDDTSVVPTVVSEISRKRYSTVQKELNAVQWHITANTLDAKYILRSLQTWGTPTQAGHPQSWRVK